MHKYLYAYANPINLTDPSGRTPTTFGQAVHDEIGDDFVAQNPRSHLYDNTVAQILTARGVGYTVGRQGNGRRPDLADIGDQEIYEIKPANPRQILSGINRLLIYLNTLNPQDPGWKGGMSYIPPGLVTIAQDPDAIYIVTPSFGGLILYTRVDINSASNGLKLLITTTIAAITAALLAQLIAKGSTRAFA